jgi:peroxiredoxin
VSPRRRSVAAVCLAILAAAGVATRLKAETVPGFTLKRLDGSVFKLEELVGRKVIVIDLWATWCKPCLKYLTRLNEIAVQDREQVEVLAITIDDASALPAVESHVRGKRFALTVLLDPDAAVARLLDPSLRVPFTLVVDREGRIRYSHAGYMPGDEDELRKILARLDRQPGL